MVMLIYHVLHMYAPRPFKLIPDKVRKKDGTAPSIRAVKDAVRSFTKEKRPVGRTGATHAWSVAACVRYVAA